MKRRNITKNLAALILALAVAFTAIPAMSGPFSAHAATPYWRNYKVVSTFGHAQIVWKELTKKQQKKISGIAIYRNGKKIATTTKDDVFYYDVKSKVGKTYTYQIKTYKKTKKTVRMYYNKKTKKWQTRKIKGAKTKKVRRNVYKYANASAKKKITVRKETKEDSESTEGNSSEKKYVTITDYQGTTRKVVKGSDEYNDPRYNRDIDGTFGKYSIEKADGIREGWYVQRDGATFEVDHNYLSYAIYVAGGADAGKLSLSLSRNEYTRTKWGTDRDNPSAKQVIYIDGDHGRRLAEIERYQGDSYKNVFFAPTNLDTGDVTITAKYGGKVIDTYTMTLNPKGTNIGLDNDDFRRYNIAKEAVDYAKNYQEYKNDVETYGEYKADMEAIKRYISHNYTYEEIPCTVAARIFELYSVLDYGIYGHFCYANQTLDHAGFRPDYACENGDFHGYFDSNGQK